MSIILENVDRHVEGTYICTASNGIGDPVSASMQVEVEYPPEVTTEQVNLWVLFIFAVKQIFPFYSFFCFPVYAFFLHTIKETSFFHTLISKGK